MFESRSLKKVCLGRNEMRLYSTWPCFYYMDFIVINFHHKGALIVRLYLFQALTMRKSNEDLQHSPDGTNEENETFEAVPL